MLNAAIMVHTFGTYPFSGAGTQGLILTVAAHSSNLQMTN